MKFKMFSRDIDDRRLTTVALLLLMPVIIDFAATSQGQPNSLVTMAIYGLVGAYAFIFAVRGVVVRTVMPIILFGILGAWSYVGTDGNREITEMPFLLCLGFWVPVSSLVILKIRDWSKFFSILRPWAMMAVVMGLYIVFFVEEGRLAALFLTYMEYSYAMLPMVLGMYVCARTNRSYVDWAFAILGFATMLSFGARASILYVCVFVGWYELMYRARRPVLTMIVVGVIALMGIYAEEIATWLVSFSMFENSRILVKFISGDLMDGGQRDMIVKACLDRMEEIGIMAPGLFGDRAYLHGAVYPHNFFYEVILDFGWLLGPLFIIWLVWMGVRAYVKRGYPLMTMFALTSLFCRYLISGSYAQEGKFWMWFFIMLSLAYYARPSDVKPISRTRLGKSAAMAGEADMAPREFKVEGE